MSTSLVCSSLCIFFALSLNSGAFSEKGPTRYLLTVKQTAENDYLPTVSRMCFYCKAAFRRTCIFVSRGRALLGRGGTGIERCSMVSLIRGRLILLLRREYRHWAEALRASRSKIEAPVRGALSTGGRDPPERRGAFGPAPFVSDPFNREWWVGEITEGLSHEMTGHRANR